MANRKAKRAQRSAFRRDSKNWPEELKLVDSDELPEGQTEGLIEVWRSKQFLLQIYVVNEAVERLSLARTTGDKDGQTAISLYEMQRLKRECGRGDKEGVIILPANGEPIDIDVGNMRHLWVFRTGMRLPFGFGERKKNDKQMGKDSSGSGD